MQSILVQVRGYLTVPLGQSQGQVVQELVDGDMDLRGEVSREVHGQNQDDVMGQDLSEEKSTLSSGQKHKPASGGFMVFSEGHVSYPEVSGVHSELEGVQLAQFGQSTTEVIDLSHGISNGSHDGGSMLPHLRRVRAQIGPVRKVGLGLRVGDQHPAKAQIRRSRYN